MTSTIKTQSNLDALPEPRGFPIIGHAINYRLDPLNFYTRCAEFGDLVKLRFGSHPVYFLNHPELIKDVFVTHGSSFLLRSKGRESRFFAPLFGNGLSTSEGSFWRRQRRLTQPAFNRTRFNRYGDIAVELTERFIETWRSGDVFEVSTTMTRLMREIVAAITFGNDGTKNSHIIEDALAASMAEYDHRNHNWLLYLLPEKFPTPKNLRYQRATKQLNGLVYELIHRRSNENEDTGDMLSMLLQVCDDNGNGMSEIELRDELVNILVGHDPIADVFTWAWWLIAQHPDVEARLTEEWQSVLRGRSPTAADLSKLQYTERVVMEVLRLYPLAWVTGRIATQDCEIGGYPIQAGENVVMCQWVTHRDRRFFEHPETFNPDRWANNLAKQLPSYAYFPFGGGARVCIGRGLTMMEAILILATVGQQFRLEPIPDQTIVPAPYPSFSLRPKYGLRMQVTAKR
jgi:cytochrome P450